MPSILVDLSDRRLYLLEGGTVVRSYPIAIGRILTQTPTGTYHIINKVPYPYSRPGRPLTLTVHFGWVCRGEDMASTEQITPLRSESGSPKDASVCIIAM